MCPSVEAQLNDLQASMDSPQTSGLWFRVTPSGAQMPLLRTGLLVYLFGPLDGTVVGVELREQESRHFPLGDTGTSFPRPEMLLAQ